MRWPPIWRRSMSAFSGRFEQRGNRTSFNLTAPLEARGAKGALLRVSALNLAGSPGQCERRAASVLCRRGTSQRQPGTEQSGVERRRIDRRCRAVGAVQLRHDARRERHHPGRDLLASGPLHLPAILNARAPRLRPSIPAASDLAREVRANICATRGQAAAGGRRAQPGPLLATREVHRPSCRWAMRKSIRPPAIWRSKAWAATSMAPLRSRAGGFPIASSRSASSRCWAAARWR